MTEIVLRKSWFKYKLHQREKLNHWFFLCEVSMLVLVEGILLERMILIDMNKRKAPVSE